MITDRERYEEDAGEKDLTGPQHWSATPHHSCRISEQNSCPWSAAWAITGWFTPYTAPDTGQREPDTSKPDAGGPETMMYKMSPRLTTGSCTQGIGSRQVSTFWELFWDVKSLQRLNNQLKTVTQSLGLCLGSQTSAGVVPFNLWATVLFIGLGLSDQIFKVICVCASLSSVCKREEMQAM